MMRVLTKFIVLRYNTVGRNIKRVVRAFHTTQSAESELKWPVQYHYMVTNQGVWPESPNGAQFKVGFVDTEYNLNPKKSQSRNKKTILYLGNEHHLDNKEILSSLQSNLFEPLVQNDCRILMPFMVGSKETSGILDSDESRFDLQLIGERGRFILDFIATRKVEKIDLVIGHSMACFSAIVLAISCEAVQRLALLSPLPFHVPPRWIKPTILSIMMINHYNKYILRLLARLQMINARRKMDGVLGKEYTNEQALHLVKTAHGIHYNRFRGITLTFMTSHKPLLYVSGSSDPSVDSAYEKEFQELIGLKEHAVDQYDELCQKVEGIFDSNRGPVRKKGINFQGAGHLPFLDEGRSKIIAREILGILDVPSEKVLKSG